MLVMHCKGAKAQVLRLKMAKRCRQMLIEFSVTNFRSIAEQQTFSMVAGRTSAHQEEYAAPSGHSLAPSCLRTACLVGPNGSGKSSFIKAFDFFSDFVKESASSSDRDEIIPVENHIFDEEMSNSPSTFEVIFTFKGNLYQYGFSVDAQRVYDEWLFMKESGDGHRLKIIFTREYDEKLKKHIWNISRNNLKGDREVWKRNTKDNSLFLSTAVMLNSEDLSIPFEWITFCLRVIENPLSVDRGFSAKKIDDGEFKEEILTFLSDMDIKIENIEVERSEFDPETDLPSEIPAELQKIMANNMKGKTIVKKIETVRKIKSGNLVKLSMLEESSGTQVLFSLSAPILHVLKEGFTLAIDEMSNTLHPLAVQHLVGLFNNKKINKNGAQLIFTNHETAVLEDDIVHKDQIWLVEKGDDYATKIKPASSYKTRESVNIRKAYLSGRFGAVPIIVGNNL